MDQRVLAWAGVAGVVVVLIVWSVIDKTQPEPPESTSPEVTIPQRSYPPGLTPRQQWFRQDFPNFFDDQPRKGRGHEL
jgi:hypothetical protein